MDRIINDFTINIATANGTGSQSANLILLQSLFDMGVPVSGKNLFPSNISGLPTCLLYTSPSPRDALTSRMPSSA